MASDQAASQGPARCGPRQCPLHNNLRSAEAIGKIGPRYQVVFLELVMKDRAFVELSTRVMKDLKEWIEAAREHHGLSADQLVTMQAAAEIIDETTNRLVIETPAE
jgi:hypothetical protein